MTKNMGFIDRIIRTTLAAAFIVMIIMGVLNGIIAIILGVLAVVFIFTSVIGHCPLYTIINVNTLPKKKNRKNIL